MIVWIGLYWFLTQLLLKTAALLRVVYEEPTAVDRSRETKEELHAKGGEKQNHGSNERYGIHLTLHLGQ
jgi:hypothetical protein